VAEIDAELLSLLASRANGWSAPELRARLRPRVSQPTLWRALDRLRSAGQVVIEGRARATRYHAAEPTAAATLRSRRLHARVAERLVRDPSLRSRGLARLQVLRQANPQGRPYHDRWQALIEGPLPPLLRLLSESSELADTLRKESPLVGLLERSERDRVFQSVRGR
jgi:hypothetical protein